MKIRNAVVALIMLFSMHLIISWSYRGDLLANVQKERYLYVNFYVFSYDAYKILATGQHQMASQILMLYSFYTYANINIPTINFKRLNTALESVVKLDKHNIQPYLTTALYWLWAKKPDSRREMARFLITGLNSFPGNWDIPYALYRIYYDLDDPSAIDYLVTASERALENDGPAWVVDMPAIMQKWLGKLSPEENIKNALRWLYETRKKTNELAVNEKYKKNLDEREANLIAELYEKDPASVIEIVKELYNIDISEEDVAVFVEQFMQESGQQLLQ